MPGLLMDITLIPLKLHGLEALMRGLAVALLGFLLPFTVLEMNVRALNAKEPPNYSALFTRVLLVVMGLLIYGKLFHFILKSTQMASFAVLSEQAWGRFLTQAFRGADAKFPTLAILFNAATSIQEIILFLSSLVAIISRDVVVMIQGCFLALLYAFGPVAIACAVHPGGARIARGWLSNSIQVASWSFILRLVVRVWLELEPLAVSAGERGLSDYLGILSVNVTFVILVLGTPLVAAKLFSGENLAALGTTAMAAVHASTIANTAFRAGRFLNAEAIQISKASDEERRSFLHHPITATMTTLYQRRFGPPQEAPGKGRKTA